MVHPFKKHVSDWKPFYPLKGRSDNLPPYYRVCTRLYYRVCTRLYYRVCNWLYSYQVVQLLDTAGFTQALPSRYIPCSKAGYIPYWTAGFILSSTAEYIPGSTAGYIPGSTAGFIPDMYRLSILCNGHNIRILVGCLGSFFSLVYWIELRMMHRLFFVR